MNAALLASIALLLAPGCAVAAAGGSTGLPPTRMQICQKEVQSAPGEQQRKSQLRECLSRRAEGERAIAADCQRQLRLGPRRSAAQERQLRDCEARALAVPSSQLPRRAPPPTETRPLSAPAAPAAAPRARPPAPRPTAPYRPPVVAPREGA